MRRNSGEHIGEPQLGIDVVFFVGRQERVDDGRALSCVVRAGKEVIPPPQGNRTDGVLDEVGVYLNTSVFRVARELLPASQTVEYGLPPRALGKTGIGLKPRFEAFEYGNGLFQSYSAPVFRRGIRLTLDVVEKPDFL